MDKKHFKAVGLRHLDQKIILKIREWRNQSFVRDMMLTQHEISENEHMHYIMNIKEDSNRDLFVFFLNDEPIGVYQYIYLEKEGYVTGGDYLICEEYQDMGYGMILSYFINVIKYDVLGFKESYDEIIDTNVKALAMAKRTGFDLNSLLKKKEIIDGKIHDVYQLRSNGNEWRNGFWSHYEKTLFRMVDENYDIIM